MANAIRRHAPALGIVLFAAFAARAAWIFFVHPDPTDGRLDDTSWYWFSAHYFANGDGYVNPLTGTPTAAWPPGYPVFLGSLFRAFGEHLPLALMANVALGTLTVAGVYGLGLLLFERTTALVAAAAMALWPGQIYFTSLVMSESLFTLLFVLGLVAIALAARSPRPHAAVLAVGVITAVAAFTRGHALLLLPLAGLWWAASGVRWQQAARWTGAATLVVGLALAPWVARNAHHLGRPVLISNNMGHNIWIGHNDGATGRIPPADIARPAPERGDMTQAEFEAAADARQLREGLEYMATHPAREIELSLVKVRALWESDASGLDWNAGFREGFYASEGLERFLRGLANGYWFAALGLAAAGLLAVRSRLTNDLLILPAIVLAWTALHVLFYGDPRYHYPVAFVLALLAARGAVALAEPLARPLPRLKRRYAPA
jgi:4-amino-4-deoxy-L-arabinose transferase-like glycosyltransferase